MSRRNRQEGQEAGEQAVLDEQLPMQETIETALEETPPTSLPPGSMFKGQDSSVDKMTQVSQTAPIKDIESSDDIQQAIKDLNEKLKKKVASEGGMGAPMPTIKMPLAKVHLKIEKHTSIQRDNVTPPELLLLVAMHHVGAGENPVLGLDLRKDVNGQNVRIETTMRHEKNRLVVRYGKNKVDALFPGVTPTLPLTFREAMAVGIGSEVPSEDLMTFTVKPFNTK